MIVVKTCPFCGSNPQVSDYAIPAVVWCANANCVLGPNTIMKDGLGKAPFQYEEKTMPVKVWNERVV